ncbi:hypothetical protein Kpol_1058p49 [Vanderwaltozyma polyspora DSM 70294]|uniref:Type 1 phosphatases regulator YPI2 n=1 Tax=Vanderwaltozyma polyspora (strain ATCC 22028 / DSM 70294 / BCRC 21397 / CBS 2163 / NBRC 10782 / NRRL Y-8283 / UCD 57-17) TaxID=436907 RepID=YPI2_VANPO|nr:uncharacterized protein Kpol_1058p49 [Vanderwaltozyma polyspora DSM 70294]A7TJT3.1 RecName: Full=Type 1 phosphatases regulator YPI2 [Vanderwaltozyma polyspora DSM 70294]EDO17512.1 hypothetical protein Kpol_1058p49 [Vanderwaltozyma polyspora DSM 70294]
MNKKKTKICCIYHPQDEDEEGCTSDHQHDELPESSSSSSSESENDKDLGFDERRKRRVERRRRKLRDNTDSAPNAYEVQPDYSEHRKKMMEKKSNNT